MRYFHIKKIETIFMFKKYPRALFDEYLIALMYFFFSYSGA